MTFRIGPFLLLLLSATACDERARDWNTPEICELQVAERSFAQSEPIELDADDSVCWLDDGRLFIERVWWPESYSMRNVDRVWVTFTPGAPARVACATWNHTPGSSGISMFYDGIGRAWVSSDGNDLGRPDSPDLLVDYECNGMWGGSDCNLGQRRLRLPADRLGAPR